MQTLKLAVETDGTITGIYSDDLAALIEQGEAFIERASHVEPDGARWLATMNDGRILGPFRLRQTALDAEVDYLEKMLGL